jgi:hypothetical protein
MFQKLAIIAAWASVSVLAFATLTNVGFVYSIYYMLAPLLMWPGMRTYAHFEHVIAFAIFGALFGFAYPRRVIFVLGRRSYQCYHARIYANFDSRSSWQAD